MNNLTAFRNFLERRYALLCLAGAILFAVLFSFATLTTKPRVWVDEAITIELAQNFLRSRTLDIAIAPDTYSGSSQLLQSTGYPVTVALAGVFYLFGPSLTAARIFMVLTLVLFLLAVFSIGRRFFGEEQALLSLFLIAAFASLYGNRTAVGEIPGALLLFAGLYFLFCRQAYFFGGALLGLAVAAKPAVFLLAVPAVLFALLLERRGFFVRSFKIGLGMAPSIFLWFLLVVGNPFSKDVWDTIFNFYKNPYGGETLFGNVMHNLGSFFDSSTLMYFGFLFVVILFARGWQKDDSLKPVYHFVIFYSIFAFIYYLRSPGWLRYILIAEFLILFLLPSALSLWYSRFSGFFLAKGIRERMAVCGAVLLLSAAQLVQLFTVSDIFYSDMAIKTAAYLSEQFPEKSVAALDALEVSTFLPHMRKYQAVTLLTGIPPMGGAEWRQAKPETVVFLSGRESSSEERLFLQEFYTHHETFYGYEIYMLKTSDDTSS